MIKLSDFEVAINNLNRTTGLFMNKSSHNGIAAYYAGGFYTLKGTPIRIACTVTKDDIKVSCIDTTSISIYAKTFTTISKFQTLFSHYVIKTIKSK
ncbi:hypothetical protein D3C76_1688550 [compost metagenome]